MGDEVTLVGAPAVVSTDYTGQNVDYYDRQQAVQTAKATKISIGRNHPSYTTNVKYAIISDVGGVPGNVLVQGGPVLLAVNGINYFDLPSEINIISGAYYWLGIICESINSQSHRRNADCTTAGYGATGRTFATFSFQNNQPLGGTFLRNWPIAVYGTLASGGAGRLIGAKSHLIGGPSPLIGGPSPLIG